MINVYSTNVTAANNMTVPLNGKAIQRGLSSTLAANGTDIALNFAGVYEVSVSAYGTTTAAGTFGFQLNGDGNAITRAASSTNVAAGEAGAVSFTTLVTATSTTGDTAGTINLTYTGGAGTIDLISVVVKRLG